MPTTVPTPSYAWTPESTRNDYMRAQIAQLGEPRTQNARGFNVPLGLPTGWTQENVNAVNSPGRQHLGLGGTHTIGGPISEDSMERMGLRLQLADAKRNAYQSNFAAGQTRPQQMMMNMMEHGNMPGRGFANMFPRAYAWGQQQAGQRGIGSATGMGKGSGTGQQQNPYLSNLLGRIQQGGGPQPISRPMSSNPGGPMSGFQMQGISNPQPASGFPSVPAPSAGQAAMTPMSGFPSVRPLSSTGPGTTAPTSRPMPAIPGTNLQNFQPRAATQFVQQPAPGTNPADTVSRLYASIGKTGNMIDQEGRDYWTNALTNGTRTVQDFYDSARFVNQRDGLPTIGTQIPRTQQTLPALNGMPGFQPRTQSSQLLAAIQQLPPAVIQQLIGSGIFDGQAGGVAGDGIGIGNPDSSDGYGFSMGDGDQGVTGLTA